MYLLKVLNIMSTYVYGYVCLQAYNKIKYYIQVVQLTAHVHVHWHLIKHFLTLYTKNYTVKIQGDVKIRSGNDTKQVIYYFWNIRLYLPTRMNHQSKCLILYCWRQFVNIYQLLSYYKSLFSCFLYLCLGFEELMTYN